VSNESIGRLPFAVLNSLSKDTYRKLPADIEILIMEELDFANFASIQPFGSIYSFGRMPSASLSIASQVLIGSS